MSFPSVTIKQQPEDLFNTYALIISGIDPDPTKHYPGSAPLYRRADMMYDALDYLRTLYPETHIADITYLTMNGSKNGLATPITVLNWIRGYANSLSMWDTLLIFYSGHGGGAYADGRIESGRVDTNDDEGLEHYKDGGWFGVDECLTLTPNEYDNTTWQEIWDDDIQEALGYAICRTVVVLNGCKEIDSNSTTSCFAGGFIDDLSGERRVIITPANETSTAYYYSNEKYKGFVYYLINTIKLEGDLKTSFDYAVANDEFNHFWNGQEFVCLETPWLDDDGDRLPNFVNGSDHLDDDQGWFSSKVIIGKNSGMLIGDINNDRVVDIADAAIIRHYWEQAVTDPSEMLKRKADINGDWIVDITDVSILVMNWQKEI